MGQALDPSEGLAPAVGGSIFTAQGAVDPNQPVPEDVWAKEDDLGPNEVKGLRIKLADVYSCVAMNYRGIRAGVDEVRVLQYLLRGVCFSLAGLVVDLGKRADDVFSKLLNGFLSLGERVGWHSCCRSHRQADIRNRLSRQLPAASPEPATLFVDASSVILRAWGPSS